MSNRTFNIGDRVTLSTPPPFFKTAEPMPMLRPPDIIAVGAEGEVTEQRAGGYWVVKFERGSFLLDAQYLASLEAGGNQASEDKTKGERANDERASDEQASEKTED